MKLIGIDYSLTSPGICIHDGQEWNIDHCTFHYLSAKPLKESNNLRGTIYPMYKTDTERYTNLSQWVLDHCVDIDHAFLEGYSYGSIGRVFQIAENTGLLKTKLWERKIPLSVFAPTDIKKFGSGKGNANKEKMFDAFVMETNMNMFEHLGIEFKKQWNPVSDMIDAYYIAKRGFYWLTNQI